MDDSPSAAEVLVNPVFNQFAESVANPLGLLGARLDFGVAGEIRQAQVQGAEGLGSDIVMTKLAATVERIYNRGPDQADQDEIVEVAGLEGGVLPVVSET